MSNDITYLFDLDGTLSSVSDEDFARRYFQLISLFANGKVDFEKLMVSLKSALEVLFDRRDGIKSNYELFMESFVHFMGDHTVKWYEDFFDEFYENEYEELEKIVSPRENVVEALKKLYGSGRKIIIATNPIFPHKAIRKRLQWVGVDEKLTNYVTTMENSHYVKPSTEYYLEILENNSLDAKYCVMIGNDYKMDGACTSAGIEYVDVSSIQSIWRTT
ncbi:HAD family hydrolase [Mesotoga sp. HF07.pep.5.2.highcov]|jgi:FMN phosphatase YigB (HAD superfamily)|uniref:HAD family hydrolase n=1 Tax=Mesotoga TaxID=1184396 RepID=UPI0002CA5E9C|nr:MULTISPECIES: HAD family hydrolase [unclassified Mesotoga]PIJ61950.1 HAD family hydrolase [Mesotoga sp. H07.pep.5.3]RLL92331.1 HAD family hydrolase [Mesotoga sp. HF07.pep.5.2.highcov]CCU85677.1 Haloacid dehalogenase domain protein hydrolase [Mesotoga infera]